MSRVKVTWKTSTALAAANGGGQAGLQKAIERIREVASGYVPLDTGALLDSAEISLQPGVARLTYTQIYAAFLWRHPEYNYQNSRRARFLEKANTDARREVLAIQAEELKSAHARHGV